MNPPDSINSIVIGAIARACNLKVEAVTPDLRIAALGLDSMNMTAVLAELEAVYDIELTSDQIIDVLQQERVSDVIQYVSAVAEAVTA